MTLREAVKDLPCLRATEDIEDPLIPVKFFALASGWTWYILEYDGEDECFGYVDGLEFEAGYIWLPELEELRWCGIPRVEVDGHWTPTRLSVIKEARG